MHVGVCVRVHVPVRAYMPGRERRGGREGVTEPRGGEWVQSQNALEKSSWLCGGKRGHG